MRISGGHFRGRVLQSVEGKGTRPTDARAREMLFNVLGQSIVGARVLDLYGGTGSVGIEALSRGAEFCVFVEQNAGACRVIKANLRTLGVESRAQVWQASVKSALRRLTEDQIRFGLVFADPPFANPRELGDLCKSLDSAAALLHNTGGRRTAASSFPCTRLARSSSEVLTRARAELEEATSPASRTLPVSPSSRALEGEFAEENGGGEAQPPIAEPHSELSLSELSLSAAPLLVIQHHRKQSPLLSGPFRLWREKRAGESTLSFFDVEEGEIEGGPSGS
jgi:16S rRNA (guanine(966)-N(2))-methyltransferase RsmD